MKKIFNIFGLALTMLMIQNTYALTESQTSQLVAALMKNDKVTSLYSKNELETLLKGAQYKQSVIDAFHRPAESLTWGRYRKIFIKQPLIDSGVAFGRKHAAVFRKVEEEFGIPKEIILAIIGVETAFGQNKGSNRIIDSLSTLSLGFERRKDFFQSELESFLVLGKEYGIDVNNTLGSYAGAMGIPQFIASSYLAYAIDYNNDGKIDLINSVDDAVGSIANYLSRRGWRYNEPIYSELKNGGQPASTVTPYVVSELKTLHKAGQLRSSNIGINVNVPDDADVNIIKLETENGNLYRAAFANFYVITTYNRSILYAMAVTELSEKIASGL